MKKGNIVISVLFLIVAMGIILLSLQLPQSVNGVPGPGTWPILVSIIMICAACTLIIQTLRGSHIGQVIWYGPNQIKVYIGMIGLLLYLVLMYYIGFFVGSLCMLYLYITWFGDYSWYKNIMIALLITSIVYLVFTKLLHVAFRFGLLF